MGIHLAFQKQLKAPKSLHLLDSGVFFVWDFFNTFFFFHAVLYEKGREKA